MDITIYKEEEIASQLAKNNLEWKVVGDSIQKKLEFKNFVEAFGFMTRVANG